MKRRKYLFVFLIIFIFVLGIGVSNKVKAEAAIYYVDSSLSVNGDGSEESPFNNINNALKKSDNDLEIHLVGSGTNYIVDAPNTAFLGDGHSSVTIIGNENYPRFGLKGASSSVGSVYLGTNLTLDYINYYNPSGTLTAYQMYCYGNDLTFLENCKVDATTFGGKDEASAGVEYGINFQVFGGGNGSNTKVGGVTVPVITRPEKWKARKNTLTFLSGDFGKIIQSGRVVHTGSKDNYIETDIVLGGTAYASYVGGSNDWTSYMNGSITIKGDARVYRVVGGALGFAYSTNVPNKVYEYYGKNVINIKENAYVKNIIGGSLGRNTGKVLMDADVEINVSGGHVEKLIGGSAAGNTHGDIYVNISGGEFGDISDEIIFGTPTGNGNVWSGTHDSGVYCGGAGSSDMASDSEIFNYCYLEDNILNPGEKVKTAGNVYGHVYANITGGIFNCDVYGGGAGHEYTGSETGLYDVAQVTKGVVLNASGAIFNKNIYGGGAGIGTDVEELQEKYTHIALAYPSITLNIGSDDKDIDTVINGCIYGGGIYPFIKSNGLDPVITMNLKNATIGKDDDPEFVAIHGGSESAGIDGNIKITIDDCNIKNQIYLGSGTGEIDGSIEISIGGKTTINGSLNLASKSGDINHNVTVDVDDIAVVQDINIGSSDSTIRGDVRINIARTTVTGDININSKPGEQNGEIEVNIGNGTEIDGTINDNTDGGTLDLNIDETTVIKGEMLYVKSYIRAEGYRGHEALTAMHIQKQEDVIYTYSWYNNNDKETVIGTGQNFTPLEEGTYFCIATYEKDGVAQTPIKSNAARYIEKSAIKKAELITDDNNPIINFYVDLSNHYDGSNATISIGSRSVESSGSLVDVSGYTYQLYKFSVELIPYDIDDNLEFSIDSENLKVVYLLKEFFKGITDNTMPVGNVIVDENPIANESIVKDDFKYVATDDAWISILYVKYPNTDHYVPYENGTIIPATNGDGWYEFYAKDRIGNQTLVSKVYLDTTAPTGLFLAGIDEINSEFTNKTIVFTWHDADATATMDGVEYIKGTEISDSGIYEFVLTDSVGNYNTYTITIDKINPTITLVGAGNNQFVKVDVTVSWSDTNLNTVTVKRNGSNYSLANGGTCELDGTYIITVTDKAGNSTIRTFTIDKTNPTITLDGADDGETVNNDVTVSWTDTNLNTAVVEKDGVKIEVSNDDELEDEGTYVITVTDRAGNSSTVTFTIDKTAPVITLDGAENEETVNNDVTVSWDDGTAVVKKNGEIIAFTNGNTIEAEGTYVITVTDEAGNSSTATFTIDKTNPTITLDGANDGETVNNDVTVSWNEGTAVVTKDAEEIEVSSGDTIEAEGTYVITVTDVAGNSSIVTFTIDKTAPVITLSGAENEETVNNDVTVSWNEGTAVVKKNDEIIAFTKGDTLEDEGVYVITVTDVAGNSSTVSFTIDKTNPTITLDGAGNEETVNNDVTVSWNEGTAVVTKDAEEITISSGDTITLEGVYIITVTDVAGNSSTVTFTIDKTAPTGSFIADEEEIANGSTTNKDVVFTWTEATATAKLDGEAYTKNTVIAEGTHTIVLTDTVGNSNTYTITIDKTNPVITLDGADDGETVNNDVTVSWNEGTAVVTKDAEEIEISSGDTLVAEGVYVITVTDVAGNISTKSFTIDKTNPVITLEGANDGETVNNDVTVSWNEGIAVVTKDAEEIEISSGDTLVAEGVYVITVTDVAGNSSTATFTIDKTDPVITLDGATDGETVNNDVTVSWNEGTAVVKKNGETIAFTKGEDITNEGVYVITVTDAAGNSSTVTFTIDKTNPTGNFIADEEEIANGSTTNKDVVFTWTEATATATLDGEAYTKDTVIAEGTHTIVLTDAVGNSNTYTITIDKTSPVGKFVADEDEIANESTTNKDVVFTWTEATATATLDGEAYTKDTVIAEGTHTIVLTDTVGNSNTYTITIDKTNPTITLDGAENEETVNNDVTVSWNEGTAVVTKDTEEITISSGDTITLEGVYIITVTDVAGNSSTATFTIDKTAPTGSFMADEEEIVNGSTTNKDVVFTWVEATATATLDGETYTKNTVIAEGTHTIVLTDTVGNTNTYTITIDKTAPVITLSGAENEETVNNNVTVTWNEGTAVVKKNGETIAFTKGDTIEAEGTYVITVTDVAGNSSTVTFTIDRTNPTGSFIADEEEIANGSTTNKDVVFTWTEATATAKLDGEAYTKNTVIAEGIHTIVLTDTVGNSNTYTITIDKTNPTITLSGAENEETVNNDVTVSWNEGTAVVTKNAEEIEISSGDTLVAEGVYVIIVTDEAGNSSTATFTIDKTAPTGTFLADEETIANESIINKDVVFTWTEAATATLDGETYTKNTVITEGTHTIVLTDAVGNSNTYTITIDKTNPVITLDGATNGETVNNNVTVSWNEGTAVVTKNAEVIEVSSGDTIEAEGAYVITVTDAAGNISTKSFTIDKTNPVITLEGANDGGTVNNDVTVSWNEGIAVVTKDAEEIEISSGDTLVAEGVYVITVTDVAGNSSTATFTIDKTDPVITLDGATDGETVNNDVTVTWNEGTAVVTKDAEEITISSGDTLEDEGTYAITVTDVAGNSSTVTFTIDKTAPTGSFMADEDEIANGSTTNKDVVFTWTETTAQATLDGETYTKNTVIAEGTHTIVLTDTVGNTNTYTITIDKTAPVITLSGAENEETVNNDVTVSWNEGTAVVTKDAEEITISSGDTITLEGVYIITVTDVAGNSSTATFTIDKTAPTGKFLADEEEIVDGSTTNKDVVFTWTETTAQAKLDGETYTKDTVIAEGTHTIVLTDAVGNSNTYTITIDKTNPVITLEGANDGETVNNDVTVSWNEGIAVVKKNGETIAFTKGDTIEAEGTYVITVTDAAGNSSTVTFTIDKTNPTITLDGATDGETVNNNVTVSWNEGTAVVTKDAEEITISSGDTLIAEGTYVITVTDVAGNSSTVTFTIDKTAPVITLDGADDGETLSNDVTVSWNEGTAVVTKDAEEITISSGDTLIAEGTYVITVTDVAGNSSTVSFTIDKTNPTITLDGAGNEETVNNDVTVSWNEGTAVVTKDAEEIEISSGDTLIAEGTYVIIVTDVAGNSSTVTFTIDKTAPVITLDGADDGETVSNDVTVSWNEGTAVVTKDAEEIEVSSGDTIEVEGTYVITVTDVAGNSSSVTFTIDKTNPVITLDGADDGETVNNNVTVSWNEGTAVVTKDAEEITISSGDTITLEGEYIITVTDVAGNSSSVTFTIDKTAPVITLSGAENEETVNNNVTVSWNEGTAVVKKNGETIAFTKGEDITNEGVYVITVTDAAGSSSTVTFTIDKTDPVITLDGANDGETVNNDVTVTWNEGTAVVTKDAEEITISSGDTITLEGVYIITVTDVAGNSSTATFTIDKTAPTGKFLANEEEIANGSTTNKDVVFTWTEATAIAKLDGEAYTKDTVIAEGTHTIVLTDTVGNSNTYTITIDKTNPVITLDGANDGETVNNDVTVSWNEGIAVVTKDAEEIEISSGDTLVAEGVYVITVTDVAGNSSTATFTIDKTNPTITLDGATDGETVNNNVTVSWNEGTAVVTKDTEEITISSGDTLEDEGTYAITVTDVAGNSSTVTFTIDKTAPTGSFMADEDEIANGSTTNKDVVFTWTETTAQATLDGETYTKNTVIAEGTHTIVLTDTVGNSNTYTITIDKTAPTGTIISGERVFESGDSTNKDISFIWSEEGLVATVNGNPYIKNEIITVDGTYTFKLTDAAGNSSTYIITIDKSIPIGELDCEDGSKVNRDVTFTFDSSKYYAEIYKDNDLVDTNTSGSVISTVDGNYEIKLISIINPESFNKYEFIIDKTLEYEVSINNEIISIDKDIKTNKNVVISNKEDLSISIKKDNIDFSYEFNSQLTLEGTYLVKVYDDLGNEQSFNIIIDKSVNIESNIADNDKTNENVVINSNEDVTISATKDGVAYEYKLSNEIVEEGSYVIKLTDSLGNEKTISFVIDKTAPTVTITGLDEENKTTGPVTISNISEDGEIKLTYNGEVIDYTLGEELTLEGSYELEVTDSLGNSRTYSFEIVKTSNDNKAPINGIAVAIIAMCIVLLFGVAFLSINWYINWKKYYRR